jgi:hypothetical protein
MTGALRLIEGAACHYAAKLSKQKNARVSDCVAVLVHMFIKVSEVF